MPVFPWGSEPERMAYGIEIVLAQAMPTPIIDSSRNHLSWTTETERSPSAPASRHVACVPRRPSRAAMVGSAHENANVTTEYIAKQSPAHSTPCVYRGDLSSGAPNTFLATAGAKYSHMQNRPSQVQN